VPLLQISTLLNLIIDLASRYFQPTIFGVSLARVCWPLNAYSAATFHTARCRFEANLERVASSINGFLMTMREESNRADADIDPVLLSFQRLADWEAKRSDYLSLTEELIR
jgi:hypothetical protein